MECKIIEIKRKPSAKDKMFISLHEEIGYIMEVASSQPRIASLALFHAGNALLDMARIIKKEHNLD